MVKSGMVTSMLPASLVKTSIVIELSREDGTAGRESWWDWYVVSEDLDALPHGSGVRVVVEVLFNAKFV